VSDATPRGPGKGQRSLMTTSGASRRSPAVDLDHSNERDLSERPYVRVPEVREMDGSGGSNSGMMFLCCFGEGSSIDTWKRRE
jgi:hypothetical protein